MFAHTNKEVVRVKSALSALMVIACSLKASKVLNFGDSVSHFLGGNVCILDFHAPDVVPLEIPEVVVATIICGWANKYIQGNLHQVRNGWIYFLQTHFIQSIISPSQSVRLRCL